MGHKQNVFIVSESFTAPGLFFGDHPTITETDICVFDGTEQDTKEHLETLPKVRLNYGCESDCRGNHMGDCFGPTTTRLTYSFRRLPLHRKHGH